jgi:tRNA(Ile)-lysidine synthase
MKKMYHLFRDHIINNQLIRTNDTVILGFSGGKDSVALFHLLHELISRKHLDFHLVVAYFNHRLRSDAPDEQEWIESFCKQHNVEQVIGGKDVMAFKSRNKLNLEHAASISRYQFFNQLSKKYPNPRVATAHTKSDLTETFLIKLFRGSGLQGLSTIYQKKENTIIRPLLLFDQDEILAFLQRNSFPYYNDSTNQGDEFLRNRIRHHVVPEILKIEPKIHHHVYKTVSIIQEEYDYFSHLALNILNRELIMNNVMAAKILAQYHIAVQRHIIREYIRLLKGNLLNIDFRHIEEVRTSWMQSKGVAIPGLELAFKKGYIFPVRFTVPNYSYTLSAPVSIDIKETGQRLNVQNTAGFKKPIQNNGIILPYSAVTFPLTLRSPMAADKYTKINSTVNQKVYEMIRASGYPSELRNLCPVLLNGDGRIIWVAGSPTAEAFKVVNGQDEGDYLSFVLQ